MRWVLVALLALHGLVHLIGVAPPERGPGESPLSGQTLFSLPELFGPGGRWLWLTACVLLVTGAAMAGGRVSGWWMPAALGVALSQVLVVYAWPDAKFGTLANLALVVPIAFGWAEARFEGRSDAIEASILAAAQASGGPDAAVVTEAEVAALPPPVARWLRAAGAVGHPRVQVVRLEQEGLLRTRADQAFMSARAHQVFTVDPPAFSWTVRLRMMAVLPVLGRDTLSDGGRGRMLITLGGLVPVVDAEGDKIDQGTLLRWLGELVWFPTAALSALLSWQADGERAAVATMRYGGQQVQARFEWDDEGRMLSLRADRYLGGDEDATQMPWVVTASEWGRPGGLLVPTRGEVTWALPEGDFTFYRWALSTIHYDPSP